MTRIERQVVRALLVTPASEVLLHHIRNPNGKWSGWITPGGGIEPGETPVQALLRELDEELGHWPQTAPVPVWVRHHEFEWFGRLNLQHETFFLVRSEKFTPNPRPAGDDPEISCTDERRWWPLDSIAVSRETFAPRRLGDHLRALITDGPPSRLTDVGE